MQDPREPGTEPENSASATPVAEPEPLLAAHQLGVLPPILPRNSINLLAGAPGAGKTTLIASTAVRFRDGLPIFGFQPRPVPFQGFISADRSWEQSTSLWFKAAGFPEIKAYSLQDDASFKKSKLRKKSERIAVLNHCLSKLGHMPEGSLVWVDPLALFLGGNLLDYDTCLVACSEIREICTQLNITIIGTAHASKQKADKAQRYLRLQDRIAGSVALFGYTDTQMYLAEPSEVAEEFYLFHMHPHHAVPASFKLQRNTTTGLFEPYGEEPGAQDLARIVLSAIPFSPTLITSKQLLTDLTTSGTSIPRTTFYRVLEQLIECRDLIKVGRGHYTRKPNILNIAKTEPS